MTLLSRSLVSDENSGQKLEIALGGLSDSVCLVIDKKRARNKEGTPSKDPTLPFVEPREPGLTSKNDAIFMVSRDGALFVFLLEMKTGNAGNYLLQMQTGKLITEFLLGLLKLHEKCDSPLPQFFGVLCYGLERKSAHKGTTRHGSAIEFEERRGLKVCDWSSPVLDAKDLVNAAKRCAL
ncbi:MAG: hypothetical protein PHT19_02545 [Methylococcus sp.]|nr:hypothetical protein [Methylococcus sp.]